MEAEKITQKGADFVEKGGENGEKPLPVGFKKPNLDPLGYFDVDRGEPAYYENATTTDSVFFPLTRAGVTALLNRAASQFSPPLPTDAAAMKILTGWVHHVDRKTATTTIQEISHVLYKSLANALTWTVDQEIKMVEQEELDKKRAAAKALAESENAQKIAEKRNAKSAKRAERSAKRSANEAAAQ